MHVNNSSNSPEKQKFLAFNENPNLKDEELFDEKIECKDFIYKEGGWGWVVVLSAGYCLGILIGMINNYALIYNELDRVYTGIENHVLYAAWIGSLSTGVQYIFCALGSIMTDFLGPRKTGITGGLISGLALAICALVEKMEIYFLTYGVLYGAGQALLLTSTLAILPHYFKKRISLANGIMNLIGAIIVVLLPILTSKIIHNYSLKGIFLFLSLLNFGTVLMAFTYIPLLPVHKHEKIIHQIKSSFGLEVFKKPKFAVWCIASFFGMFGYLIPIVNIDHHSIKAFPNDDPVYINIVFGAASGVAAIVFGKIGDLTKFHRVHYHTLVFLVYGIVQFLIPYARSFTELLFQMAILGLMDGVLLCFIVTISFDLAESSKLANHAAGYYHVAISLPSIAGPAVAGKIYELVHSYNYAFYLGAASSLIGSLILIVFITCFELMEKKKQKSQEKAVE
ncbi:unnamed protein product [Brachionus calyciflorus]|uniref:Major facilitator superfamily (MFS) profile domain-containing protein n=1 Tax=Brachionus calyciflorus TaxID=104777 RepID=A0A813SVW2_9BILA|nr:unnamed protein product [Brachionus calyciflorus]